MAENIQHYSKKPAIEFYQIVYCVFELQIQNIEKVERNDLVKLDKNQLDISNRI
jgi:hypothetical protein